MYFVLVLINYFLSHTCSLVFKPEEKRKNYKMNMRVSIKKHKDHIEPHILNADCTFDILLII